MISTISKIFFLICLIAIVPLEAQSSKKPKIEVKPTPAKQSSPSKTNPIEEPKAKFCYQEGVLKFSSDNNECPMYIETPEGKKYIPVEFPENTHLEKINGIQHIRFSYELMKNIKLNCPLKNLYIKLDCIENIKNIEVLQSPTTKVTSCDDIIDPFSVEWMNQCILKLHPKEIKKYDYQEKFAYSFVTEDKSYYYNCLGELLCEVGADKKCTIDLSELSNPFTILVVND